MNEDFSVYPAVILGFFALIIGVLLYIPAHFWVKRGLQKDPEAAKRQTLTKAGLILFGGTGAVELIGFGAAQIAGAPPETRNLIALVVTLICALIGYVLLACGVKIFEREEDNHL